MKSREDICGVGWEVRTEELPTSCRSAASSTCGNQTGTRVSQSNRNRGEDSRRWGRGTKKRRGDGEAKRLVTVRRRAGAERPSSAASESARSRTRSACAASWDASRPAISLSTSSSARRTATGFSAAISTSGVRVRSSG